MAFSLTDCGDGASLAAEVASRIAERLRAAIQEDGRASLVVPGGTTPIAVFDILAATPLEWRNVIVIPCDERWVPAEHPDSNEGHIRHHLLQDLATQAHVLSLYRPYPTPAEAVAEVSTALHTVRRPYSAVFLGMGEDSHFASLFPGRAETAAALDLNSSDGLMVLQAPAKGHPRIGLTLSALIDTPSVILAVTGKEKRVVLDQAIANIKDDTLPIAALLRQSRTPVDILLSE